MATETTKSDPISGQKINIILVVADDKRTSSLESFVLEDEGYSVTSAGSGEEALKMVPSISPSLILLDIILPQMDGFSTFEMIRETSQVPIIMIASEEGDEDMVRGLEMGADDYITRPFSTTVLAARVKAVLRRTDASQATTVAARPGTFEQGMSSPNEPEEATASSTVEALEEAGGMSGAGSKISPGRNGDSAMAVDASLTAPKASEENYEGAVKLVVESTGVIKSMVDFVDSLRENPQFHLLRMVSNARRDGMDVWIRLRSPNPLRSTLLATAGVSEVQAVESSEFDPETGAKMPTLRVSLD